MPNTYLSRTTGSPTNSYKGTFSAWIKKGDIGNSRQELITEYTDGNNRSYIGFNSSDKLEVGSVQSSSWVIDLGYTRVFRDVNAWYHIVMAFDTTQSTASNRVKLYVNGVQETNIPGSPTYPSQNSSIAINSASKSITIGASRYGGVSGGFNGSMSHIHFIDGTAYDASAFGSTDATTGEWEAKTSPSVTYGTNGFFILKDGNGITDQSGEGNDFTLGGGTLTDLKDNPDNVFATLNSIGNVYGHTYTGTFSNGNLSYVTGGNSSIAFSTIETVSSSSNGFYYEIKCGTLDSNRTYIGLIDPSYSSTSPNGGLQNFNEKAVINSNGQYYNTANGTTVVATYTSFLENDIIMVAYKNGSIWFGKNGTWMNSGNPSTGANAIDTNINTDRTWLPAFGYNSNFNVNFGNGFFGTTAITTNSGNGYSGAEGSSKFNYTVPTGYSALSTKGLNE